MKSNKSKEMAHKIKLAKGWRNERRSRRQWRRTKTGCPAASCWRHKKKKATRLIVQLSCCWWGRTQPWLLLWGGKRHLLAAAGSYGKGNVAGGGVPPLLVWERERVREWGRKEEEEKEGGEGEGSDGSPKSIRVSRFLYSLLLLLLLFFFFSIYFLARPTKELTFVGSNILINNHFDSNLFI